MSTLQAFDIRQLSFSLAQAQHLSGLAFERGQYHAMAAASPDWLASLALHSQQQADLLLSTLTLDGRAFNYQQALNDSAQLQLSTLSARHIQQLHQRLHPKGGQWRNVKVTLPLRHQPSTSLTVHQHSASAGSSLDELLKVLRGHIAAGIEPLVAIPLFIYDFLRLFPFLNGNRRIALLLAKQLLIEHGHEVLRYQAIETFVVASDPQFYQQLYLCSHQQAPLTDWLSYWWLLIAQCYQGFHQAQQRAAITNKRGSKTQLIRQTLQSFNQPFSLSDLSAQLPTIGPDMIRKVVRDCRGLGLLRSTGRGRAAKWIYLHDPVDQQ